MLQAHLAGKFCCSAGVFVVAGFMPHGLDKLVEVFYEQSGFDVEATQDEIRRNLGLPSILSTAVEFQPVADA